MAGGPDEHVHAELVTAALHTEALVEHLVRLEQLPLLVGAHRTRVVAVAQLAHPEVRCHTDTKTAMLL